MAKVIKDTPEDPIAYLIKVLKRLYSEGGPKVRLFFLLSNLSLCKGQGRGEGR